jgi:hypothetical protein
MFRLVVAFCAACVGVATAVADVAVALPLLPPREPGVKPTLEEDRVLFDALLTFYGTTFATGRLIYWRWRARVEAEELRRWSRGYLIFLNVLGSFYLVASGVPALQQAILRPSLVVGLLLTILTIWDGWLKLQAFLRTSPLGP